MRINRTAAIAFAGLATLSGCKSGGKQLPNQVGVSISPATQTWTVPERADNCAYVDYGNHLDELVTVRVSDGEGRALGNTSVLFSLSLSSNSHDAPRGFYQEMAEDMFTGEPVSMVELYYDRNGDMRPQPEELVSGMEDSLFSASTDRYNGDIQLIVRMNLSCRYSATLDAFVGGFSGSAEFSVEYRKAEREEGGGDDGEQDE